MGKHRLPWRYGNIVTLPLVTYTPHPPFPIMIPYKELPIRGDVSCHGDGRSGRRMKMMQLDGLMQSPLYSTMFGGQK